jgi:signal transduction histidine kinase
MDRERLLPNLELDELLGELQARLSAVLAAREGMRSLLDAVLSIGSDLELETVLQRIVEAARRLADCRYGALGVIGEDGQLAEFVPVGLSEEEISAIREWPHGRGLLGLLIKHPQTLRLAEIGDHPESFGFPPGHPPMRGFLGVPILVRDSVFGNLYLTEKSGGAEFDEQDETIVKALATAAGVAIENARLYQETRAREIWLDAIAEVTRILLSGADRIEALTHVATRAREMTGAVVGVIALSVGDGEQLRVVIADGHPELVGLEVSRTGSVTGAVLKTGKPVMITDPADSKLPAPLLSRLPGPSLLLPLGDVEAGMLVVSRRQGSAPFSVEAMRMLGAFAQQVGVVMELADARREAEQYGLLDDRERIARDLHDVVVQRLYGVGMQLMGAAKLTDKPQVEQRIQGAVTNLDDTIRQIRSTIFALQSPDGGHDDRLRSRITAIVDDATGQLGFAPGIRMSGLLDTNVPDELADDLVAVLGECLSNVVRHAAASQVDVAVTVTEAGELVARVTDNGVGIADGGRRSGLANLAQRAERWGGSFEVRAGEPGGTLAVWRVTTGGGRRS